MNFLPNLVRAGFKNGDKRFLNEAFKRGQIFSLPSFVVSREYQTTTFYKKLEAFNTMHNWSGAELHPCFAQVLGLGQQMDVLLHHDSPFPLIGLVHLGNQIKIKRLLINEDLTLSCRFGEVVFHKKGIVFTVIIEVIQFNQVCITAQSEYLHRVKLTASNNSRVNNSSTAHSDAEISDIPQEQDRVEKQPIFLKTSSGRRYAKLSGDYNPIHLWPWSARSLGFPTTIAHGMHTLALVVSAIQAKQLRRFSDCVISNQFLNPAFLPCALELQFQSNSNSTSRFDLINPAAPEHKCQLVSGTILPMD